MFLKIGIKALCKSKGRTALAVIAIMIGSGLLTGIGVLTDSYLYSFSLSVTAQLGKTDFIIKNDTGAPLPSNVLDVVQSTPGYVDHTYRQMFSEVFVIAPELTDKDGFEVTIFGIDTETDRGYGAVEFDKIDENLTDIETIEDILAQNSSWCVVTSWVAEVFLLDIGDTIYIPAYDSDRGNSSTWQKYEIKGIILDWGEGMDIVPSETKESAPMKHTRAIFLCMNETTRILNITEPNLLYVHVDFSQMSSAYKYLEPKILAMGLSIANGKEYLLSALRETSSSLLSILVVFSSVSLIVGAILILNVMEAGVEERKYQIGVLRAIGSRKSEIFRMFLGQSIVIGLIGASLGLMFGTAMCPLMEEVVMSNAPYTESPFKLVYVFTPTPFITGFAVGILTTLVAGIGPTYSAAKISIVDALRPKYTPPSRKRQVMGVIFGVIFILLGAFMVLRTPKFIRISGVIPFIIGLVTVSSVTIPIIVIFLAILLRPVIGIFTGISRKTLKKAGRRTTLTYVMFSLSVAFMVMASTVFYSISIGFYNAAPKSVGSDIALYTEGSTFGSEVLLERNFSYIENATMISTFTTEYHGDKILVHIIQPQRFMATAAYINIKSGGTVEEVFAKLDDVPNATLIWEPLAKKYNLDVGDPFELTMCLKGDFYVLNETFTFHVVGIFDRISGISGSWQHYWSIEKYPIVISWKTMQEYFENITAWLPEVNFVVKGDNHDLIFDDLPYFNYTEFKQLISNYSYINCSARTWAEGQIFGIFKKGVPEKYETINIGFVEPTLKSTTKIIETLNPNWTTIEDAIAENSSYAVITTYLSGYLDVHAGDEITVVMENDSGFIYKNFTVAMIINMSKTISAINFHTINPFYMSNVMRSDEAIIVHWNNSEFFKINGTREVWLHFPEYFERHIYLLEELKQVLGPEYAIADVRWTLLASVAYAPKWLVKLKPGVDVDTSIEEIKVFLSDHRYVLLGWDTVELFRERYSKMIDFQKSMLMIVLTFATVAASLGIAVSIIISVSRRRNQIGVLRAIGAKKSEIARMILGESLMLSLTGFIVGVIIGIISGFLMMRSVTLPEVVMIRFLVNWNDLFFTFAITLASAVGSAIYPMYAALRLNIIDAIRRR